MDEGRRTNDGAIELIIGGGCFGFFFGWSACAGWKQDWPALALAALIALVYLAYRRYRIARSIGVEVCDV